MDYITECYYSRMRPYRDRPDISVPGRWHWCPEGAQVIPYFHRFGSFTMDAGEERIDPAVGEIPRKNGRSRGESGPGYTGQHFCGSAEAWTEGILFQDATPVAINEDGIPVCCGVDPDLPGGDEVGGDADQHLTGGGGLEFGGIGASPPSFERHALGGVELGGVGFPGPSSERHAFGGLEWGGIVTDPPQPFEQHAVGGLQWGGIVTHPPQPSFRFGYGGLDFGGRGDRPLETRLISTGGLIFDGRGDKPLETQFRVSGGLEFGGIGDKPLSSEIHALGGLEFGGIGDKPLSSEIHALGGLELGKPADASGLVPTPACPGGVPRHLYAVWFTAGVHICGCAPGDNRIELFRPVGSDAWTGAAHFGGCGTTWTWEVRNTGVAATDWVITIRWSTGYEVVFPAGTAAATCFTFSWITVFSTFSGPGTGCGGDDVEATVAVLADL